MDWEGLKRVALGPLGLMPQQFWEMTPGELKDMVEGFKLRDELEWRKIAQLAAWITSPHLKKPITADRLLGKNKQKKRTTPEETKAELQQLMARMGAAGGDIIGDTGRDAG